MTFFIIIGYQNNQFNKGVKSYWLLLNNSSHNFTPHNSEGLVILVLKLFLDK